MAGILEEEYGLNSRELYHLATRGDSAQPIRGIDFFTPKGGWREDLIVKDLLEEVDKLEEEGG